jgi:hypothetical protein
MVELPNLEDLATEPREEFEISCWRCYFSSGVIRLPGKGKKE